MEKIKGILIDDELNSLQNLQQKLEGFCPDVEIIAISQKPEEGILLIRQHQPDVVFLDIEMPRMSGFRMLEELSDYDFDIIFTTAYNHYSIDAIRISAFDYLVKPIGIEELQHAVERLSKMRHKQTKEKIDILKKSLSDNRSQEDKIAISTSEGIEFIPIKNIIHVESKSNYSKIYLGDNKTIVVSKILKDFEEMLLPYNFYRIHNSHLINLNYIQKYVRSQGGQVMLQDGTLIDISRRKKEEFLKMIGG
ncbi:MAG: LytTR family DNA-binding domain-containing protein [Bacteroidota bacterium]|nr:LytTR family DNA-binding domain-containing protein [Bacteroidota bacterium]